MQTFFKGISFRLATVGLLLALGLGVLMSSIHLYIDFSQHDENLKTQVETIIEVATPPATRAVHTLDSDLAKEVVGGLLVYDFIDHVSILDELGEVLAQKAEPQEQKVSYWFTSLFFNNAREYSAQLILPGYNRSVTGELRIQVDVDQAMAPFFQRSLIIVGFGFFRNVVLVLLLFVVFHYLITRPLIKISTAIQRIDPSKPGEGYLSWNTSGREDELSLLVSSCNHLLEAMELALAKRYAVELTLRKSEEHVRQIIDSMPVLVGARNEKGHYVFANKALADFIGMTPEEVNHCHVSRLPQRFTGDLGRLAEIDSKVINQGHEVRLMERSVHNDRNERRYLQTYFMPMEFYDERVSLAIAVDITERKETQAKMEHMAYHDSLTNLPNRVQLEERLEHEIKRAKRHGYYGAVLFVDLDQFKNINDSLGHPVGDLVLRQVSERLIQSVREEDLVARLSGDEFVLILTVLDKDMSVAALKAGEVAEKIRASLVKPYLYQDMELRVTASLGVVVYPDGESNVHEFLRYADTAMYQVKEKGRNDIAFFNENMADKVSRQLLLEAELHRALDEGQFLLNYQPKVGLLADEIVGAEVLIRWMHPERGMISPVEFIPILETSGLIIEVGAWVLQQACQQVAVWRGLGLWQDDMSLSVNVSPRQFRSAGFIDTVQRSVELCQLPHKTLDLEVTESIVIQSVEDTIKIMAELDDAGITFSLDDFGTGYSSLSYLKRLPVSTLKIDRSFVRDLVDDDNDKVLVETIITLARLMDMNVVAEGVEDKEQLELLRGYDCHQYQGYYFSRPVKAEEFVELLKG